MSHRDHGRGLGCGLGLCAALGVGLSTSSSVGQVQGARAGDAGGAGGAGRRTIAEHVIIIGVDGLSPMGVEHADAPAMRELIRRGSHTMAARGVFPTSSSSNWASMIMGAQPESHGITSNDWRADGRGIAPAVTGADPGLFPTLFGAVRAARPEARIVVVYDWGDFGRLFEKSVVDVDIDGDGPEATTEAAIAALREAPPDLLFVHLDHVDGAGHRFGWHTPPYFGAVARADALIGQIVSVVEELGLTDRTAILVTSDHGGLGTGHGGETMDELEIPWIIAGAGIAAGRQIEAPVSTTDTAATAAMLLGIEPLRAWTGDPVREALASFDGPGVRRAALLPRPLIMPEGGLFVERGPQVTIACPAEGADVRYTLDGSDPTLASPRYAGPFGLDRSAVVRARAFLDGAASTPTSREYRVAADRRDRGLRFEYYEGEWEQLPSFEALEPVAVGWAPEVALITVPHRVDFFAVRFSGVLEVEAEGEHGFALVSDDGSRLLINGQVVVDNDGQHGPIRRSGSVRLGPGEHQIVVEYFETHGGQTISAMHTPPGGVERVLSLEVLRPE